MKSIILCGGGGTRLWPESTPDCPKQFMKVNSAQSLIAETVLRLLPLMRPEDMVLVTNALYAEAARAELEAVGCEAAHIVCEPAARNTAPAIALGVSYIRDEIGADNDEIIFVAPSDHIINNRKAFYNSLRQAETLAGQDYFVTFGIVPDYPETGYGYIEAGDECGNGYLVSRFHEKPQRELAAQYLSAGNYYWNSGMFMFKLSTFVDELAEHAPDVSAHFATGYAKALAEFSAVAKISVDYAIAERTARAVVVPLAAGWNDVGSWDSVYDISAKDDSDNVLSGQVKCLDCSGVMVRANSRSVALAGVDDLLVVETDKAVLIIKRSRSQAVREFAEHFKE